MNQLQQILGSLYLQYRKIRITRRIFQYANRYIASDRSCNVLSTRSVYFLSIQEREHCLRILPLFLSVHVELVPATYCDISRHITTTNPPPPPPTNLFNFLVSFLLWIQRETIVGSDLDLCVHVAGVEIFFYTIPLDDGENGSPTSPSTPHKEKKNKRETLWFACLFFLLFFFFFFLLCYTRSFCNYLS